jgi:hypothetical protein
LGEAFRYLQYLNQIRIAHLERIRGFVVRKYRYGGTLMMATAATENDAQEACIRAVSHLEFLIQEAMACQEFAYGLFCVWSPDFSSFSFPTLFFSSLLSLEE